jgi:hypothetical protein
MKYMSEGEAETKRQKAITFLHNIGNDDAAAEFEHMTPAEYAEPKGAQLMQNPTRRTSMPKTKSKAELEDELSDAQDYIAELEGKLNDIVGIASDEPEEDEEDDSEDDDDDSDSDDDDDSEDDDLD